MGNHIDCHMWIDYHIDCNNAESDANPDAKPDGHSSANYSGANHCCRGCWRDAAPLPGSREPLRQCRVLRLRLLVFLRRRLLRQLVFLLRCARLRHIERVLLWRQ